MVVVPSCLLSTFQSKLVFSFFKCCVVKFVAIWFQALVMTYFQVNVTDLIVVGLHHALKHDR